MTVSENGGRTGEKMKEIKTGGNKNKRKSKSKKQLNEKKKTPSGEERAFAGLNTGQSKSRLQEKEHKNVSMKTRPLHRGGGGKKKTPKRMTMKYRSWPKKQMTVRKNCGNRRHKKGVRLPKTKEETIVRGGSSWGGPTVLPGCVKKKGRGGRTF